MEQSWLPKVRAFFEGSKLREVSVVTDIPPMLPPGWRYADFIPESDHLAAVEKARSEGRAEAFREAVGECDSWFDLLEIDHRTKLRDGIYSDPQEGGREYRNICNIVSAVRSAIKVKSRGGE